MKKILYFIAAVVVCIPVMYTIGQSSVSRHAQCAQQVMQRPTPTSPKNERREVREQRRAERLAEFEKFIDSVVMSHHFQFNPTTMQMQPAGSTRIITNPNYEVGIWGGVVDICLPYIRGYVPPYQLTILNYTIPSVQDFITEQTPEGWNVRFTTSLFTAGEYTFNFEIYSKMGGATLTIKNPWYNDVQYSGTITAIY